MNTIRLPRGVEADYPDRHIDAILMLVRMSRGLDVQREIDEQTPLGVELDTLSDADWVKYNTLLKQQQ